MHARTRFWMPRIVFRTMSGSAIWCASHVHNVGNTVAQYEFNLVQGPEPTDTMRGTFVAAAVNLAA